MANYTEKDLNDILVDYLNLKLGCVEELYARYSEAASPVASGLAVGDIAAACVNLRTAASIVIDLNIDKLAVKLSSELLGELKRIAGDTEGGGL